MSKDTVLIYARAWLDRFPRPKPGGRVQLPDDPWPPTTLEDSRYANVVDREAIETQAALDGTGASKAVDIAKNTKAMAAAIVASPVVARAAINAIGRANPDAGAAAAAVLAAALPEVAAAAVENEPAARLAGARTRLNRAASPERRRQAREDQAARAARMNAAGASAQATLEHSGLVDHEATLNVQSARMWLRKAATNYERNPVMTEMQREHTDIALAECEHLCALLHGQADSWTSTDHSFLEQLGIDGDGVTL